MPSQSQHRPGSAAIIAGLAAAALLASAPAGLAATAASPATVRGTPAAGTPHFLAHTRVTEQIRQIVACGSTMYAVGRFSTVVQGSRTYRRDNAFSFSAAAPYRMTSWAPRVNGTVNSITFSRGNCANAYIGGTFTRVGRARARDIAEVRSRGGTLIGGFRHDADKTVETLAGYRGHILAGGYYTRINGSSADPYMTSLNARTGRDDGLLRLRIHGQYWYPGVSGNPTRIYNQQISHSGRLDLVEGDFRWAGGRRRQQMFMLNLASRPRATVTGWTSPQFDGSRGNINVKGGYPYQCTRTEPFYIRSAAWSPNDSTIYTASTGYRPWNLPRTLPLRGLCDAAAAFPAMQRPVLRKWVNYDGCYSLYSAAADGSTAYFAGHELWSQSPNGCKKTLDPHRIPAPGFEGLSPRTGRLAFNPTRSRGLGADDLLVTREGLWIASDNAQGSQMCGGVQNLAGLCLLPY
ncbi:MAG: hypothetical protein ACLP52_31330 [Streptosporangiaceae bacterium]